MTHPLRIGLIGVGGVGAMHLAAIEGLARQGRAVLAAVADPFCDRLPEGVRARLKDVPQHLDYRQMLEGGHGLDAVVISTPIQFHFEMAKEVLLRGHYIYLEKPPVPLIQQLDELIALDGQGRIAVGFQQIASRSLQKLKRWILEGRLGEIREIRAAAIWPRLDHYYTRASWAGKLMVGSLPVFDGPATNALAHVLHNIMFLAGGTQEGFTRPAGVRAEIHQARPLDSYDTVCMRGTLASGPGFTAAFTHAARDYMGWRMDVCGSGGTARLLEIPDGDAGEFTLCIEPMDELFAETYSDFADFATGRITRPLTGPADAGGYVLATNGALLSSGGIHEIPPPHAVMYNPEGDSGYDIAGAKGMMDRVLGEGLLFSEQGIPWARESATVSTENLSSIPFADIVEKIRGKRGTPSI